MDGGGVQSAIEGRVKQLRAQIEETASDYDREKLQERVAKIIGGVAIINIGAATETEMKEKKARIEAGIIRNAGMEEAVVLNTVLQGNGDFGYNAQTDTYENLLAAGIIDPAKVVRFALQNAASVAGLMLTTEAMIAEKPPKKKVAAMSAGKGMDDDIY